MAGLPKKYFKAFPGNLKKAWAAYKRDKSGRKVSARGSKKKITIKRVKTRSPMAAKKKSKVASAARRVAGRAKGFMTGRAGQVAMTALVATGGGIATSMLINKAPMVRDWSRGTKVLTQIGLGVAGVVFFKKPILKSMFAGAAMAGVFGASKEFLKIDPLAGDARTLSPEALLSLVRGGSMGVPANTRMGIPANTRMGVPASVSMNGSGFAQSNAF